MKAEVELYEKEGIKLKIIYMNGKAARFGIDFPQDRFKYPDQVDIMFKAFGLQSGIQPTQTSIAGDNWNDAINSLYFVGIGTNGTTNNSAIYITMLNIITDSQYDI